jgi:hypothetical protein
MLQKLAQSVIPKRNVSENQSADLVTSPLRQRSPDRGEILGMIALIFAVWTVVTTTRHSTLLLAVAVLALGYLAVDRWHRSLENSPQMSVPIHREWEFCGLSKRK